MNLYEKINATPDALPVSWKPQDGDVIVGTVAGYQQGEGVYGPVTILLLDEEDREGKPTGDRVSVWLVHTMLWGEVRRLRPKPGERLAIRRLSDNPNKSYKRYTVLVDRQNDQSTSWTPDWEKSDPALAAGLRSNGSGPADSPDPESGFGDDLSDAVDDLPF
ncbi:hypothetical protein ACFL5T_00180 [Gemmatimonadota bacterium]